MTLPALSAEQAQQLLVTVAYHDRLPAGRLEPHLGIVRGYVRSLDEACRLLAPQSRSLPAINLQSLADWIETALGDGPLAAALRHEERQAACYVDGCLKAHELLNTRLDQALAATEKRGQEE